MNLRKPPNPLRKLGNGIADTEPASFHPHYDGRSVQIERGSWAYSDTSPRFTDRELAYEDQRSNLTAIMQAYLTTMADLGAETWLMHGTLLGWWWNRKVHQVRK